MYSPAWSIFDVMMCLFHCFRSVTEQYLGKKFKEFVSLPKWEFLDYLGWGDQGDGKLFYGIYVQVRPRAKAYTGFAFLPSRTRLHFLFS